MIKLTKLSLILGMSVAATSLIADMPQNSYACHVITQENNVGISFLQADTLKEAETEALLVKAIISDEGEKELPLTLMQCITEPGEFDDYTAQKLMESIPR